MKILERNTGHKVPKRFTSYYREFKDAYKYWSKQSLTKTEKKIEFNNYSSKMAISIQKESENKYNIEKKQDSSNDQNKDLELLNEIIENYKYCKIVEGMSDEDKKIHKLIGNYRTEDTGSRSCYDVTDVIGYQKRDFTETKLIKPSQKLKNLYYELLTEICQDDQNGDVKGLYLKNAWWNGYDFMEKKQKEDIYQKIFEYLE